MKLSKYWLYFHTKIIGVTKSFVQAVVSGSYNVGAVDSSKSIKYNFLTVYSGRGLGCILLGLGRFGGIPNLPFLFNEIMNNFLKLLEPQFYIAINCES